MANQLFSPAFRRCGGSNTTNLKDSSEKGIFVKSTTGGVSSLCTGRAVYSGRDHRPQHRADFGSRAGRSAQSISSAATNEAAGRGAGFRPDGGRAAEIGRAHV